MFKRKMSVLVALLVAIPIVYFGWLMTARAGYESAEYKVLESDGEFEIRRYPELTLAATSMNFASRGNDGSFMRLFRYISRGNSNSQKVAMTVPVFMETDPDRSTTMGFVVPNQIVNTGVPDPIDESVSIRQRIGGRFAVVTFSGRVDATTISAMERRLRRWIAERDLLPCDSFEVAGYDPPFTPGPFRRNEVLIRLK